MLTYKHNKGFTLIEMMVAVSLFSVVMVVSITSLLSLIDANRKAQGIQSVMNNLNVALDGMVRSLRMGHNYNKIDDSRIEFTPFGKPAETWSYYFVKTTPPGSPEARGRLYKKYTIEGIGGVDIPITAEEVDIDYMRFYISGETSTDDFQPRVMMVVRGKAGTDKARTITKFDIQASATQRILDL